MIVACIGTTMLAVLARNGIDHPPIYDELLHVLAARGIVETGIPSVADGFYTRALAYSQAVAWAFELRGDDLVSARLPALLAGLLLVAFVSGWTALRAGRAAGAATAIVLAISPITVQMSVFARFYTFHALAIAVAVIAGFEATARDRPAWGRLLLAGLSIAALAAAWQLQDITFIAAISLGVACAVALRMERTLPPLSLRHARPLAALLAVILIAVVVTSCNVSRYWSLFFGSAAWAEHHANEPQFYLIRGADQLPLLWPLAPLLAVAVLTRWKRLGGYAAAFFALSLVGQSVAGQKAMRYLFYAWPFLCVVLGCGISMAGAAGLQLVRNVGLSSQARATAAVVVLAALTIVMSQEGQRTIKWLSGDLQPFDRGAYEADWTGAVKSLATDLGGHPVLVTSNSMKALYYIGDYDYEFNPSVVPETHSGQEFGTDYRTGRPVIGTVESLAAVTLREDRVLVLIERKKISSSFFARTGAVRWLGDNCSELQTLAHGPLRAWSCR